ncbi:MAG: hypothetical protein JST40_06030 [Armatimonadetes bacterium]|nr:hypothetical protein [Armatimonadota bacterium]
MRKYLSILALALVAGAQAQIAYDSAEDSVYIVGQEYIQVGTTLGDQTAATNGLNGGYGFEKWQRGGYGDNNNFGSTKITNVSSSFHMGTKQFGLRSGVGGLDYSGCDARRRMINDFEIGQILTFSVMPGGGGAGQESTTGDFGCEFRGSSLSNPGRDMFAFNASKGQNYSIQDNTGSRFTDVPVVPGQRVDFEVWSTALNHFSIKITPYGGTSHTYTVESISSAQNVKLRTIQFYAYTTDGDSYVNFLKVALPTHPVTGKVILDDYLGTVAGQSVKFEILDGSNNVVQTTTGSLDASGNYSLATSLVGNYKIAATASHWLRKLSGTVNITASGASGVNFTLINGDIDGDNSVTIFDYLVLSDYFDKNESDSDWNTVGSNLHAPKEADLDGDGSVTVFDYVVLSNNFDKTGD